MDINSNSVNFTNVANADNLPVSGGGQQKTVERVGEAKTNSSPGRTTMSYNVKMTMNDGTKRSFKITVGFTREQLEAHFSGELAEGSTLEGTIDKIVNGMKANDIMNAAGHRISARLDDLNNATVTKLQGGRESKSLGELKDSQDESERNMASSISNVINTFKTNDVGKLLLSTLNPETSSSGAHSSTVKTGNREKPVKKEEMPQSKKKDKLNFLTELLKGSFSRLRKSSSSGAARRAKSCVKQASKTEVVALASTVQTGSQFYETFIDEACESIGKYERDDDPPVHYEKNVNTILFTENEKQVTNNSEKGGFVNKDGNSVEDTKDDNNNLKLFENDQIQNRTQNPNDKTGKPDPKVRPRTLPELNQKAKEALFKGCNKPPTKKKRLKFMQEFQAHLKYMPPVQKEENQDNPVTTLLQFFGGNQGLLDAYKAAVKEERNSEEFREAVFIEASEKQKTNPCPGQKMVMYIGGPSAAGKSFTRGAFVEKVREIKERERIPNTDKADVKDDRSLLKGNDTSSAEDDCYVVSIDGGIDREMCQMRQMVLQAALAKGYAGIKDLHKHTKTSVKGFVKKAAMAEGNNMHVVIPATFISGFQNFVKMFWSLGKKSNVYQVFAEVRADHTTNMGDKKADESFRQTIRYNGDSRAYLLQGKPDFNMENMCMNNRKLPCESKVYEPKYFGLGVMFSKRAKGVFKLLASSKRSIILSNESDNMHVDANGNQTTTRPAVKHISRREVNLWKLIQSEKISKVEIEPHVKQFGLTPDKEDKLINIIINRAASTDEGVKEKKFDFKDLASFQKFLRDNRIGSQLKVTETRNTFISAWFKSG